jgi:thiol-disulfide isomerase/thioredoxin
MGMPAKIPFILLAALLAVRPPLVAAEKAPAGAKIGQLLPDRVLQGLNGHSRRLSDYRGRPLIINVWASWCGPCKQEMASLERMAWAEQSHSFSIIGISTDDFRQLALNWLEQSHSTISQFIDTRRQMEDLLGASKIPLTVLISPDGRVLRRIYGAREWDTPQSLQLIRSAFGF